MYGDLEQGDADWAFEPLRPQAQKSQGEPSRAPPPVELPTGHSR